MNIEHLVQMANQVGAFFESEPDRQEAENSVAAHLKRFWDPRMRQALLQYVDDRKDTGLKEIVLSAIAHNRESLTAAPAPRREG